MTSTKHAKLTLSVSNNSLVPDKRGADIMHIPRYTLLFDQKSDDIPCAVYLLCKNEEFIDCNLGTPSGVLRYQSHLLT